MEPIGQKTAHTSSEEAIFTTDLEVESGGKETEKIFDSTLDQMLAEESDYENMLDELLEEGGQDSLISYVHQNQFDSEIEAEETVDTLSDHTLFPTETMKPDLSSEEVRVAICPIGSIFTISFFCGHFCYQICRFRCSHTGKNQ